MEKPTIIIPEIATLGEKYYRELRLTGKLTPDQAEETALQWAAQAAYQVTDQMKLHQKQAYDWVAGALRIGVRRARLREMEDTDDKQP